MRILFCYAWQKFHCCAQWYAQISHPLWLLHFGRFRFAHRSLCKDVKDTCLFGTTKSIRCKFCLKLEYIYVPENFSNLSLFYYVFLFLFCMDDFLNTIRILPLKYYRKLTQACFFSQNFWWGGGGNLLSGTIFGTHRGRSQMVGGLAPETKSDEGGLGKIVRWG